MDVLKSLVDELKASDEVYYTMHLHRINKLSDVSLSQPLPTKQDFYLFVNGKYVPFKITDKYVLKAIIDHEIMRNTST